MQIFKVSAVKTEAMAIACLDVHVALSSPPGVNSVIYSNIFCAFIPLNVDVFTIKNVNFDNMPNVGVIEWLLSVVSRLDEQGNYKPFLNILN